MTYSLYTICQLLMADLHIGYSHDRESSVFSAVITHTVNAKSATGEKRRLAPCSSAYRSQGRLHACVSRAMHIVLKSVLYNAHNHEASKARLLCVGLAISNKAPTALLSQFA